MNTINILTIINLVVALGTIVGGYVAFRLSANRQAAEIQERVIKALEVQLEAMRIKIEQLERENERLSQVITTIKAAMRKRGFIISVDGEIVYVQNGGSLQAQHIPGQQSEQGHV